jgi:hypothetical protein
MEIIIGFILGLIFMIGIFIAYIYIPLSNYNYATSSKKEYYVNESTHTPPQPDIATQLNAPVSDPIPTPSIPNPDVLILPNGVQVPKTKIIGSEEICKAKKLEMTYYMTRNNSTLGLPSKQIILEPEIGYDPIRDDCVYPIQTYGPTAKTWLSKNIRIPLKYVQNMKLQQ